MGSIALAWDCFVARRVVVGVLIRELGSLKTFC